MNCRGKLLSYFQRHDRGWVLSLFAAVCIVYLPFLGSPFIFDDLNFFTGTVPDTYAHSTFQFNIRWLPYASLGWTAVVFSDVVTHFFHLGNALLHAANVILLFYLLRLLFGAVMPNHENPKALVWGAWLGALVFACHPVAVYAVGYVIQRTILMATLFALLMQLAYLRGLLTGQKRWLLLAVAAYFAACFSKEHSLMSLAVLAAITVLLRFQIRVGARMLWLTWGAFVAIALLVVSVSKGVFGTPYEPMAAELFEQHGLVESTPMLYLLSVLTQAGLFFKYLGLWLLPNPAWMSVDMREPFVSSIAEWRGWLGAAAFLAYGLVAVRLLSRGGIKGLAGLALLYPWLQFMVEFSAIRVQEPFVLYRSYLWLPGMMLLIPLLLAKPVLSAVEGLAGRMPPGRGMLAGAALVMLLLIPLSWNRLWVFADTYRLWNDAALLLPGERTPGADRIFYNRGQASATAQDWEAAVADYRRAVALSPQLAPLRYALGMAYVNSKSYREAITQFDVGITLKSDNGYAYFGKGLALMGLHERDQALQQMKKGCELGNKNACMMVEWSHFKWPPSRK